MRALLTSLLLPPLLLVWAVLGGAALAWRGRRAGAVVAVLAAAAVMLLATPFAAGMLLASLEREVRVEAPAVPPEAIIVLSADIARTRDGAEIGALTLERLRAGAALQRRTGLPLLVTGGSLAPGDPPVAGLMAASLAADFGVTARWVEDRARNTSENAQLSVAMLRAAGPGSAYLVTHAWHLPRAHAAFAQEGFPTLAAPVRLDRIPDGRATDWLPRADHLGRSWYALREWAGRLVHALHG